MDFATVPVQNYNNKTILRPVGYHSAENRISRGQSTDSTPSNADSDNTFGSLSASARDSPISTRSNSRVDSSISNSGAEGNVPRPYTTYAGKLKVKYEQVEEEEEDDDEYYAYSENNDEAVETPNPPGSYSPHQNNNSNVLRSSTSHDSLREAQNQYQKQVAFNEEDSRHLHPNPPLRSGSLYDMNQNQNQNDMIRSPSSLLTVVRNQSRSSSPMRPSVDESEPEVNMRTAGSLRGLKQEYQNSSARRQEESTDYSKLRQTIREVHARDGDGDGSPRNEEEGNFYRRATHRSKLLEFIPPSFAQPITSSRGIQNVHNLPDWSTIRPGEL